MIYIEPCEETLKRFEDNSIDLIITSPPYNIGKMHSNRLQFGSYANNDMKEPDYQKWQIEVLNECYRVLSENGSMFYNHKVRIKNGKAIHPMEWILKTDFVIKQEITWDMGKSANCDKIRFFPFSERIYWLTKNSKVKAVIAFSPGEYFGEKLNLKTAISGYKKPLFVTSTLDEANDITTLISEIKTSVVRQFIPKEQGVHGSSALWKSNPNYNEYWLEVIKFLCTLNKNASITCK